MNGKNRQMETVRKWWMTAAISWMAAVGIAQDIDTLTVKRREAGRHIIVIADMETHRPLQHAAVKLSSGEQLDVGWTGRFEMMHEHFDSAQVMCPNYLTRHMTSQQLQQTDTVLLIPTGMMLSEVTVYGKANRIHAFDSVDLREIAIAATPPPGAASFDFANLIDRRKRRDKKHLKRAKKILENY